MTPAVVRTRRVGDWRVLGQQDFSVILRGTRGKCSSLVSSLELGGVVPGVMLKTREVAGWREEWKKGLDQNWESVGGELHDGGKQEKHNE